MKPRSEPQLMPPDDFWFATFLVSAAIAVWLFDAWQRGRRMRKWLEKFEQKEVLDRHFGGGK